MKRWRTRTIIREYPALASLPAERAAVLVDALERRLPWWWPSVAGTLVMWLWISLMTVATELTDDSILDIRALVSAAGPLRDVVGVFLFLIMAAGLGMLALLEVRRSMLRRAIRTHLDEPRCFWCGYSLRGLSAARQHEPPPLITCPECGGESAAAFAINTP
jgi:hypothetical protein